METEKREKKLSKNELEILKTLASWGPLSAYEIYKKINKRIDYSTVRKILKKLESKKYVAKQESEGKTEQKKVLYKLTLYGLANATYYEFDYTKIDLFEYISSIIYHWKELDDVVLANWKKITEVFPRREAIMALQSALSLVLNPPPFVLYRIWSNPQVQQKVPEKIVLNNRDDKKEFRKQFFFTLFMRYFDGSSSSLEELAKKIKEIPEIQPFVIPWLEEEKKSSFENYTEYYNRYSYYNNLLLLIKNSLQKP